MTDDAVHGDARNGTIVTFYSYKGGTGRTMALANVAWILAANGNRVLVADWDLESPGLNKFLYPFLGQAERDTPGVIELIRAYERVAARSDVRARLDRHIPESARVSRYAFSLNWSFPGDATLDFLPAGQQNVEYSATLSAMDWDNFYTALNGGEFLDALRQDMKRNYDYALIDSRTGLTDVADICTVQMPDVLVDCFTLSSQGIEGAARVARRIESQYSDRGIRILPVPMRVDQGEKERVEAGRAFAMRLFAGLPAEVSDTQRREYWGSVEVPYQPFYAFEEMLAVFGDHQGDPRSLLSSFERIAAQVTGGRVTGLPAIDDDVRNRLRLQYVRRPLLESNRVAVEFYPEDQAWAEWITEVLMSGGFAVRQRLLTAPAESDGTDPAEVAAPATVTVVSPSYLARREGASEAHPGYAVYVTVAQPLPEFALTSSVSLSGAAEEEAIDRIQTLLGITGNTRSPAVSYPGNEPRVLRVNARNNRFTGREEDLRQLRDALRASGTAVVVSPVAVHGLGGVGKTQIALEYVHRFIADYDLVWWIDCEEPNFIDVALSELADRVQSAFGVSPPAAPTPDLKARFVLDTLATSRTVPRWLLVYDNAEDIDAVSRYLPAGGGHVLLTSRNGDWAASTRPIEVEVFQRDESLAHLMRVVPGIAREEANEVAEVLGDLPLAVESAAVWLKDTGYPVAEYLRRLEQNAPRTLSIGQLDTYPRRVANAWDPSLSLLRERSPAAARLLELCSVMAPAIARDLVYSPAMASVLEPFDPDLSEPVVIGRVVHEVSKLGLLKVDANTRQIQVHRLVQAVVRDLMSADELGAARGDVQRILVESRPREAVDDPESWPKYRMIWPHLRPCDAISSREELVRQLFVDRVRYLWVLGDLERGNAQGDQAGDRWEDMLDEETSPAVVRRMRQQLLQLRFNQANVLRSQSRFADARRLDETTLSEQRDLLGVDHAHSLMTAGSLAADLRAVGRYREALEMDRTTYAAWTELYGEDDRRSLAAANNLAVSLRVTGDVTSALRLDSATTEQFRTTLGARHPSTLLSIRNLCRDLLEAGEYQEAVTRVAEVHRSCADALGTDSPAALDAQVLFGIALRSSGRTLDAVPHFAEALAALTKRFGDESSATLSCRLSRSTNQLNLDQVAAAEDEIRYVLRQYEARLGAEHPHTLVCQVNLASALRLREHYTDSMELLRAVTPVIEKVLGETHPYALAATMVTGTLLSDLGEVEEAERVESRVARGMEESLGAEHPDTLRCLSNLLLTRQQLGIHGARAERAEVVERLAGLLGVDHPTIETLRRERRLVRALDPQPF